MATSATATAAGYSLLLSVAVMSAAMLATALLPTHASVGPIAALLLILLRCVMGFAVGGEYSGVVAYLLEGAKAERRGFIASLASAASEIGALMAVAASALTVTLTTPEQLANWGWRIPFFIGAALAGSIAIARSTMQRIARIPSASRPPAPSPTARSLMCSARSGPACGVRSPFRRWDRSLIMSGLFTCPPSSPRPAA